MGTAVSRLRRPCLSLRLLLYIAISSRAEVAGSGVTSGLAAVPGRGKKEKREKMHLSCCNFSSFLVTVSAAEKIRATGQKIPVNPVTLRETPHI